MPSSVPEIRLSQLKEKIAAIKAEMRKLAKTREQLPNAGGQISQCASTTFADVGLRWLWSPTSSHADHTQLAVRGRKTFRSASQAGTDVGSIPITRSNPSQSQPAITKPTSRCSAQGCSPTMVCVGCGFSQPLCLVLGDLN